MSLSKKHASISDLIEALWSIQKQWKRLKHYRIFDEWDRAPTNEEKSDAQDLVLLIRVLINKIEDNLLRLVDSISSKESLLLWTSSEIKKWGVSASESLLVIDPVDKNNANDMRSIIKAEHIIDECWKQALLLVGLHEIPEGHNPLSVVIKILRSLPTVIQTLQETYRNRRNFEKGDEYDVQQILYSSLKNEFGDVEREVPTVNICGHSAKIDFLIVPEQIGIEVKRANKNLRNVQLRKQLADDMICYSNLQDCKTLVCFVYDPKFFIKNPRGFERDLVNEINEMKVVGVVAPQMTGDVE